MIEVPSLLRRTWVLLAIAFVAVLPVAFVCGRAFLDEAAPRCDGTFVLAPNASTTLPPNAERVDNRPTDPRTGFAVRVTGEPNLERFDLPPRTYRNLRVERIEHDREKEGRERICGRLFVDWPGGSPGEVRVVRDPRSEVFAVTDTSGYRFFSFFAKATPTRHLQFDRLVEAQHLPAIVVALALGALAIAVVRSRRGIVYATRLHAWTEGELGDGGRVLSPNGETLGIVASPERLAHGPVLVATTTSSESLYRELPVLEMRDVARGSHAQWREATMRGLRDAGVLAAVSVACSAVALVAHLIG